ncbi:6-phosphogluconolactonase [Rhodoblastus sphagnicola]|uniref:6-phosphogluconolactonase n=1 Tax=Rhodoblastus sphagnicola TaxID=333368 RepID=A0A2S6N3P0_9HYPH|nr:6-phosphogluconolactonase [Rhodoblastus sphagnicola]MBB4198963.1 6-phosphogluconolactonase [Rhodoblastus sphagnicola]PPQ29241.1 6-phosphogluconolactonase [Rhodoblastus sphagnicola]
MTARTRDPATGISAAEPEAAAVSDRKLRIFRDRGALAEGAAEWLLGVATEKAGAFTVALSGGSTPRALYERLAAPPYQEAFPWARTHLFWGDERFVPHNDAQSNFRMAREALLSRVPIPAGNIHPVPTQGASPETAAAAYQHELMDYYGAEALAPERPLFDVTLLGLGADGHTASLFPGAAVLGEQHSWVAAVADAKNLARITLTYPALESSRLVVFLVTGKEKSAVFARLRRGDRALPAALLHPVGNLWQFVDAECAGIS